MYTILIVEDDADLRELLVQALPHYGSFRVTGAADGISGLERCQALLPDCLVIDVIMPGMDGYQLVRALRGDARTALIPLVLLTALSQDRDRLVGLWSGADRFVQKPIGPQDLAAIVMDAIGINDAERQRQYQILAEREAHRDV